MVDHDWTMLGNDTSLDGYNNHDQLMVASMADFQNGKAGSSSVF